MINIMKKILVFIAIFVLASCFKNKTESYKIDNHEYIIKTDSLNTKVTNKDTLNFYYLKDKLRCVVVNNFIEPEYDSVKDDPFYFKTIYFINENNEFNAILLELNNIKFIRDFKQNAEFELGDDIWKNRGTLEDYFYDSELLNLDLALTKNNDYNYPKSVRTISNEKLLELIIEQDKQIALYSVKDLEKIKNQFYKKSPFKYLRDIKVIKKENEKLVLAKIIERESNAEYYINLKDVEGDVVSAD